jgi:hypothetical protein
MVSRMGRLLVGGDPRLIVSTTGKGKEKNLALAVTTGCTSSELPGAVVSFGTGTCGVRYLDWKDTFNSYQEKLGINVSRIGGCESGDSGLSALGRTPYNVGLAHGVDKCTRSNGRL